MKSVFILILFLLGTAKADSLDFLAPPFQRQDSTELIRLVSELERLTPQTHSQKIDWMVSRYFLSVAYDKEGKIHAKQNELNRVLESCETFEKNRYADLDAKLKARLVSVCLMATSEMLNYVSSFEGWSLANFKDSYFTDLELSRLESSEALYVEAIIYSNLPPLYGQKLGKALLNLEMLKRLHPEYRNLQELAESIRILQGKMDGPRVIKDGLNFGVFPTIYGAIPQGLGLQVRFLDDRIGEKSRAIRGRIFGSIRGSLGGEFRYDDEALFEETESTLKGSFLYGIQEFHGLGIQSPKESADLYITRVTGALSFKKYFCEFCSLTLGWQLNSVHLRHTDTPVVTTGLIGFMNSFDSGVFAALNLDTTDSRYDPHEGRLLSFCGYFPVKEILSTYGFESFEFSYSEYLKLGLKNTLRASVMVDSVSDSSPFWSLPQLSGRISLPAVRLTRFQEKNALGAWLELRGRQWDPLTWIAFVTSGTVADRFSSLFNQEIKFGLGGGGELKLSRFRPRILRFEVGSFASEFILKAQFGIPID